MVALGVCLKLEHPAQSIAAKASSKMGVVDKRILILPGPI
jgi:hypothetical protein